MDMPKFITKWRRKWTVNRVVANGRAMQKLRVTKAGIDPAIWPDDYVAFSEMIATRERRHDKMLAYLKNTA